MTNTIRNIKTPNYTQSFNNLSIILYSFTSKTTDKNVKLKNDADLLR